MTNENNLNNDLNIDSNKSNGTLAISGKAEISKGGHSSLNVSPPAPLIVKSTSAKRVGPIIKQKTIKQLKQLQIAQAPNNPVITTFGKKRVPEGSNGPTQAYIQIGVFDGKRAVDEFDKREKPEKTEGDGHAPDCTCLNDSI